MFLPKRIFVLSLVVIAVLCGANSVFAAQWIPLMPMPAQLAVEAGTVPIDAQVTVGISGDGYRSELVKKALRRAVDRLARQTGIPIRFNPVAFESALLQVTVQSAGHTGPQRLGDDESYSLESTNGRIGITAAHPLGVLRAVETLLQMAQPDAPGSPPGFCFPAVRVRDQPRFPWRGLSLDVSRHFVPIDGMERTLDGMAAVKLNVLHWHVSDDEGFRIESKLFPLFQARASDGLYYTQEQVREIVRYAADRGIRVVPEFDMPGHATSWFAAYPNLATGEGHYQIVHWPTPPVAVMDPSREDTYRFLDAFIGEMAGLFPDQYFHIGGDEVNPERWNENSAVRTFMHKHGLGDGAALQGYFTGRVANIVMRHGKTPVIWAGVLTPDSPTILTEAWRDKKSLADTARAGGDAILSTGYYLDLLQPASEHYLVDPLGDEAANLTDDQKKRVLGGEAAMWEEIASAETLDSRLWPRLAAIAERFWSPASVKDVSFMYARLEVINHWLEWLELTQLSNLRLMRQRLAGTMPVAPLDLFASVLEPVKDFARQPHYGLFTPLNTLADSIPPESDTARKFSDEVNRFLAEPTSSRAPDSIIEQLTAWTSNMPALRRVLLGNSLLSEHVDTAEALERLCRAGLESVRTISSGQRLSAEWKKDSLSAIEDCAKPHGETVIQIAPAIAKLVSAVPADEPASATHQK